MNRSIVVATFLVVSVGSGLAGDASVDDDQAFDDAVRQFGYAGGAAWQCSAATERSEIERQALLAYNGLARLFGTDQAFFFATSFGAGTMDEIKKEDCIKQIDKFSREMSKAQKAK